MHNYGLTERYDFTGHGGDTPPHLNQDIVDIQAGVTLINSGTSRKNLDGYKGLGRPHHIKLFEDD